MQEGGLSVHPRHLRTRALSARSKGKQGEPGLRRGGCRALHPLLPPAEGLSLCSSPKGWHSRQHKALSVQLRQSVVGHLKLLLSLLLNLLPFLGTSYSAAACNTDFYEVPLGGPRLNLCRQQLSVGCACVGGRNSGIISWAVRTTLIASVIFKSWLQMLEEGKGHPSKTSEMGTSSFLFLT